MYLLSSANGERVRRVLSYGAINRYATRYDFSWFCIVECVAQYRPPSTIL